MKVKVGKESKATRAIGEMMPSGQIGMIAEMIKDPAKLDSFIPGISQKAAALAAAVGDDSPEFPVVRVEEGWSNSRRLWDGQELQSIAEQTNDLEPVGHLGHIPDNEASTSMPEPQTTWLGAVVRDEPSRLKHRLGEMVKTAYFAGYNLPGAKIRTLIPSRAVRGVSWWGTGEQITIPGKGVQVRGFKLKALDWARKLSEGMPSSQVIAIAKEMEGDKMDKDLAAVTPDEFKEHNPNGYALLVTQIEAKSATRISEMEQEIDGLKKEKTLLDKVCEAVGLDPAKAEDLISKVQDLQARVGAKAKATVEETVAKLLKEKIPGDDNDETIKQKRALVGRLLPVAEMTSKVADAKPDEAETMIGEMITSAFNTDEMIQMTVSEMSPPVVRRREALTGGTDKLDAALTSYGVQRERKVLA